MHYQQYSARDFAADAHFINWVKNADRQTEIFWAQWLIQHPEKKPVIEEARRLVLAFQFKTDPDAADRVQHVWQRIQFTRHLAPPMPAPRRTRWLAPDWIFRSHWQKRAAVFIGLLLLSAFLVIKLREHQSTAYHTAFGQIRRITLPDGSIATLNANSTLTVRGNWEDSREVWLEGEAFFAVQRKKGSGSDKGTSFSKFTVHTPAMRVEVLGTAFNVFNRRQQTVVVLNAGIVRLHLPGAAKNVVMKPGDLVEAAGPGPTLTRKKVNPPDFNAWTHQEWILNDLSLPEVAAKIEETYGVTVSIRRKDASAAVVTGAVPTDNLDVLLQALSTTLNLKITRNQQQILIE